MFSLVQTTQRLSYACFKGMLLGCLLFLLFLGVACNHANSSAEFHSDKPVLSFYTISDASKPGWTLINIPGDPKDMGYINTTSDMSVFSGVYSVTHSDPTHTYELSFKFGPDDTEKLKTLTTGIVGKRMAIMVNSQIVMTPRIMAPIPNGQAIIDSSDDSILKLVQALSSNN